MKDVKELIKRKLNKKRKKKNIKFNLIQFVFDNKVIIKIFKILKKIGIFLIFIIFLPLVILFVVLNGFIGIFFPDENEEDLLDE